MSLVTAAHRPVLADVIARPSARARALAVDATLVMTGALVVALLAKLAFWIGPIPITGQTLGVVVVGAALGSRRGAAALTAYMIAGLAGAPVFAGALAGPAYVLLPSFGFVVGFIPAAFVAGWFAERAWDRKPWLAFIGFVVASIIPFILGLPYMALVLSLAGEMTVTPALIWEVGVADFIVPGLVKAALAAVIIPAAWLAVRRVDRSRTR